MFEAAANYVWQSLVSIGFAVAREPYQVEHLGVTHTVANIVAEHVAECGSDGIVIVGAHYDTVSSTPGADDNASAVAMLLEVARLLRQTRPRRKIRFVSFPCEEPPHFHTDSMGSQQHARLCKARGETIEGMVCLEMVGYYSDAAGSQRLPGAIPRWLRPAFPRRGNFLGAVANLRSARMLWTFRRGFKRANALPLYTIALPERVREIRLSDNSSFWDQGYPAIMVTDTSFLRNPNYHLASDTPDTLDYPRMADATIGVAGGVAALARADGSIALSGPRPA